MDLASPDRSVRRSSRLICILTVCAYGLTGCAWSSIEGGPRVVRDGGADSTPKLDVPDGGPDVVEPPEVVDGGDMQALDGGDPIPDVIVPPPEPEPMQCPEAGGQGDPCCRRDMASPVGDTPSLRVVALDLELPLGFANDEAIPAILQTAIDENRINWLLRLDPAGTILTGAARAPTIAPDGPFVFFASDAPGPGDVSRADPFRATITWHGGSFDTGVIAGPVVIPIDGLGSVELPFRWVSLHATTTDDRACIGRRVGESWELPDDARLEAAMTIEDTQVIGLGSEAGSVCGVLAGGSPCSDARTSWRYLPDLRCDDHGCSAACDGTTTCNAWRVRGRFGAAATPVIERPMREPREPIDPPVM